VLTLELGAVALGLLSFISLLFLGEPLIMERWKREGLAKPIDVVREATLNSSLQDGLPGCGVKSLG
jgi:hypothetical protein